MKVRSPLSLGLVLAAGLVLPPYDTHAQPAHVGSSLTVWLSVPKRMTRQPRTLVIPIPLARPGKIPMIIKPFRGQICFVPVRTLPQRNECLMPSTRGVSELEGPESKHQDHPGPISASSASHRP